MRPVEVSYFGFALYFLIGLAFGIFTNFIKPRWRWIIFFLLIYVGITISCWPSVWAGGILEGIWLIVSQGTLLYFMPVLLILGFPFLVGRYGWQVVLKILKKGRIKEK